MARTFPPKVDGPPPTGGGRDTGGETSQREMGDAGDFGVGGQYGTTLASYQITRKLYVSAKSRVSSAIHLPTGEAVALKAIAKEQLTADEIVKVLRELRLFRALRHKHIVKSFVSFHENEVIYMVTELAAHGDLLSVCRLYQSRCLPPTVAVDMVMRPLLSALSFMHKRSIIHRDIKPENLLVDATGTLKLCDFGLAINTTEDIAVSRVGTLVFMAPEVVRLAPRHADELRRLREAGRQQYGCPVDIWATACVAFEVLYGYALFSGPRQTVEADILNRPLAMPSRTAAGELVSEAAKSFLLSALVRDPAERPTAEALLQHEWLVPGAAAAEAAAASAAELGAGSPAASTPVPPERRRSRRARSVPGLVTLQRAVSPGGAGDAGAESNASTASPGASTRSSAGLRSSRRVAPLPPGGSEPEDPEVAAARLGALASRGASGHAWLAAAAASASGQRAQRQRQEQQSDGSVTAFLKAAWQRLKGGPSTTDGGASNLSRQWSGGSSSVQSGRGARRGGLPRSSSLPNTTGAMQGVRSGSSSGATDPSFASMRQRRLSSATSGTSGTSSGGAWRLRRRGSVSASVESLRFSSSATSGAASGGAGGAAGAESDTGAGSAHSGGGGETRRGALAAAVSSPPPSSVARSMSGGSSVSWTTASARADARRAGGAAAGTTGGGSGPAGGVLSSIIASTASAIFRSRSAATLPHGSPSSRTGSGSGGSSLTACFRPRRATCDDDDDDDDDGFDDSSVQSGASGQGRRGPSSKNTSTRLARAGNTGRTISGTGNSFTVGFESSFIASNPSSHGPGPVGEALSASVKPVRPGAAVKIKTDGCEPLGRRDTDWADGVEGWLFRWGLDAAGACDPCGCDDCCGCGGGRWFTTAARRPSSAALSASLRGDNIYGLEFGGVLRNAGRVF